MHTKVARSLGESEQRLYALSRIVRLSVFESVARGETGSDVDLRSARPRAPVVAYRPFPVLSPACAGSISVFFRLRSLAPSRRRMRGRSWLRSGEPASPAVPGTF
jgi:hypothetical protein